MVRGICRGSGLSQNRPDAVGQNPGLLPEWGRRREAGATAPRRRAWVGERRRAESGTPSYQGVTHVGRSQATDAPAGTPRVWAHDLAPQPSRGAALTAGRRSRPTLHGHKVWPTSFVLLDYLHQRGLPPQARVLELGCGWGLVGIACAKMFQAQVTGLDADAAVFPYLQLHAQRNGVHLATRQGTFADLTPQDLAAFDLIVGADICFWEDLVDPLYQLIRHSVAAGVAEILVADPVGRPLTSSVRDVCRRATRRCSPGR